MKYICILVLLFSLTACDKDYQEPDFLGINNIRVTEITGTQARLKGIAQFHNPNKQQLKLKAINVKIMLEDKVIGNIDEEMNTKIPSQSDFEVPLAASFNISDIGLLNGLLSILGGKSISVRYQGNIKVTYFGYPQTVPVDFRTDIKI